MKNKLLQPIDEIKANFEMSKPKTKKKPSFVKMKRNSVMDKVLLKKNPQINVPAPVIAENRYITVGRKKEVIEEDEPLTFHQQLMMDTSIYVNMEEVRKEGIHIYRIEDMIPNPYVGNELNVCDAYLIFKSEGDDEHSPPVRFCKWIGPYATADKKTSSTIWAVGCRALLQVLRTEEYFDGERIFNLQVDEDEENAFPSAIKPRIDDVFTRVYRIVGKLNPQGYLVAPYLSSLVSDGVFIIDNGTCIYVWYGAVASLVEKSKCYMIANTIKYSRGGKINIQVILEGEEPEDFKQILSLKAVSTESLASREDVENTLQVYHSKQNMQSLQSLVMLNDRDWYEAAQHNLGYMYFILI